MYFIVHFCQSSFHKAQQGCCIIIWLPIFFFRYTHQSLHTHTCGVATYVLASLSKDTWSHFSLISTFSTIEPENCMGTVDRLRSVEFRGFNNVWDKEKKGSSLHLVCNRYCIFQCLILMNFQFAFHCFLGQWVFTKNLYLEKSNRRLNAY